MRKKRTPRYYIGQIHLWLGLVSGLVVLIVSVTGCLFVFQKEITEALHPRWYYCVAPAGNPTTLPLAGLRQTAQAALGAGHPLSTIVAYREGDRTWEFMAYKENDTALTIFGTMEYYESVFLDPYTGKVTGFRDFKYDFFSVVKYLHWSLLLNTSYGQPIVAWSTVIFVLLLLTGLVLWWPKKWTKALRDRSFKIKWKASFRRVNYDLHNVPGFYSLIPALVIAITGLLFVWPPATPPPPAFSSTPGAVAASPLDQALQTSRDSLPSSVRFGVSPAFGKEGVIYVYAYRDGETYYGYDVLQFDQYSGRLLNHLQNAKKSRMQRLVEMNYDLHVGAIAGLTGKIIAFIASLICASLPVTGFLVWYLKKYKKKTPDVGAKIA
ncbi:PepSY-associated TM helix domain-containing protein [Puia sp.]|jgi:uncharacterized iron-regulated membrane protein|uniref:PepSY-associated TM helix domain-containing protein n=1 Tax=Puia sp. TaxID=2045100 RepID=UPI002F3EF995